MLILDNVLNPDFDLKAAVATTEVRGYAFKQHALSELARRLLLHEVETIELVASDHITQPINADKPNQVRQQHERGYFAYGDARIPIANLVVDNLVDEVRNLAVWPKLRAWVPSEIGYQRYRDNHDWIGPHRDRASDQLLSVTFTLLGSAAVKIFETTGKDPNDYQRLRQTDEFQTTAGSIMLLRAPGFGNGEQVVHQVLPPLSGSRSIVNLRMRPDILPVSSEDQK